MHVIRAAQFVRVGAPLPFRVPSSPSELTAAMMTDVLRFRNYLGPRGRVASVMLKPIGEGAGAFGELCLVEMVLEGALPGAPTSFVAKFSPKDVPIHLRSFTRSQFLREAHFYNDFSIAGGGLPRPHCYLVAQSSPASSSSRFVMLIERATAEVAYTRISGCDDAGRLKLLMAAVGSFHARWWEHGRKPPLEWVQPMGSPDSKLWRAAYGFAWKRMASLAVWDDVYAPIVGWRAAARRHVRALVAALHAPPTTLCHLDLHLDNVFFGSQYPGGVAFIDFANMALAPPMRDVAFFLGINLDVPVRRALDAELVRVYHDALLAGGVRDYSFERCWRDYRLQLWYVLFVHVLCAVVTPGFAKQRRNRTGIYAPDERLTKADRTAAATFAAVNRRLVGALVDHRCDELLAQVADEASDGCCGCA